ncbi:hypothetical protein MMC13_006291 [Lambiella insularis]|nr:hypothetical protein [Lambiella insularis]
MATLPLYISRLLTSPRRGIDKYKKAAHGAAWYNEENEFTFNPFQKIHSRTSQRNIPQDVETGLHIPRNPTQKSESGAFPTSAELLRRSQQNPDSRTPKHGSTFPQALPTTMGGPSANLSSKEIFGNDDIERTYGDKDPENYVNKEVETGPQERHEPSEDSNTSATLTGDNAPQNAVQDDGDTSQPRKRKLGGLLGKFRKHKDDEKEAVEDDDQSKPKPKFTAMSQLRATLLNSYINVLLILVPVGIALNYAGNLNPIAVFTINFIAIIPLAGMLSYATEEIALRTGETIGGLLNATFGNAVELIISIVALTQNQVLIVQTSLIGSILSNLLLVMGMCFFFGGLNRVEQFFNVTVAQTASSLLALAVGSLLIPTAFYIWSSADPAQNETNVTELSRGVSILLLVTYGAYLFFQLKSHADMYNEPSKKVGKRRVHAGKGDASKGIAQMGANMSAMTGGDISQENPMQLESKEQPQLSIVVAIFTLAASTALVAVCSECVVDNINYLTDGSNGISKTFVGLILLPIVGNAAEHATAVTVACKDKMDLAIGVAVGSSLQIALFVLPAIVTIGWMIGNPCMNLNFDGFQIVVLFVAVLLINYLIGDGKSHWLEGAKMLQVLYIIIAVSAWFYPPPTQICVK